MVVTMLRSYPNRYNDVVYNQGKTYDIPDGYAELLIQYKYAKVGKRKNK